MQDLHKIQMRILRELLFKPHSRFTDLNANGLTNDHLSYHVRALKELGLVEKDVDRYSLTIQGKEFANRMDTDQNSLEKQPKVAVLIIPETELDGTIKYAIQTRLKEPYYGYRGFMSGKVRFGEKIFETAARELREEMNLEAEYEYLYTLHEIVYDKEGSLLEDKFFNIIRAFNIKGKLLEEYEGGSNEWLSLAEFNVMSPKFHNEDEIMQWALDKSHGFKEEIYYIDSF